MEQTITLRHAMNKENYILLVDVQKFSNQVLFSCRCFFFKKLCSFPTKYHDVHFNLIYCFFAHVPKCSNSKYASQEQSTEVYFSNKIKQHVGVCVCVCVYDNDDYHLNTMLTHKKHNKIHTYTYDNHISFTEQSEMLNAYLQDKTWITHIAYKHKKYLYEHSLMAYRNKNKWFMFLFCFRTTSHG